MIRSFETHRIREYRELSSSLWNFYTLGANETAEGKGAGLSVPVPSCWETYPQTLTYRGKACYERTFEAGGNIRLSFEGVSHTAAVFLDGKQVASHYNAFTPFEAVVPGLNKGLHRLKVVAENSYSPDSTLHFPNDYQSYGGISRGVMLELLPDTYITQMHFTPVRREDAWHGHVKLSLRNLSDQDFSGTVELSLAQAEYHDTADRTHEGQGHTQEHSACTLDEPCCTQERSDRMLDDPCCTQHIHIPAGSAAVIQIDDLPFPGVKSWSVESPVLYFLSAVLKNAEGVMLDDLIDRIGFREFKTEGSRLLLNGKPFQIRGLCRHEDHPDYGCAIPFQEMYRDLALMKDLGANAVRTVHYPNDQLFLDLCDELGMLVWEEGHARALSEEQMRHPLFMKQSTDGIREMIGAHYNHPSICIWGFLNECASDTPYGKECYRQHYDLVRSLDNSRPCSFSSCQKGTDICLGIPDIVSFNIYPEWYEDKPAAEYLDWLLSWIDHDTEGAGRPFLITEIGAGAVYGYRTPYRVKWSEEYQAQAVKDQLRAVLDNPRCSGVFIWQFCDVRVSDEWFFSRPRTMNNKGIVDEYRRPKLAYDVVKKIFQG